MPLRGFAVAAHLGELATHYAQHRRREGPFTRETVVVPSSSMSGWLERFLAHPSRPGSSGVVAQLFTVYWSRLVELALYDSPEDYEVWGARALGLSLLEWGEGRIDPASARARGQRLATWISHRGEELDDILGRDALEPERRVVEERRRRGLATPFEAYRSGSLRARGPLLDGFDVFAAPESPLGALGLSMVADLVDQVEVGIYLVSPTAPESTSREMSTRNRWARRGKDGVGLWTTALGVTPEWVGNALRAPVLEVHAAVGLAREVDAARDIVFEALGDPTLELEQIRVVTMDPDAAGPLVDVAFSPATSQMPGVPYERADGGGSRVSERGDSLLRLVDLVSGDLTVEDVAGVLSDPRLAHGMGFESEGATRARHLAREGWVTMGWDAPSREGLGVYGPNDDRGTWRRLFDRVALSTALEPEGGWLGVHPFGTPTDLDIITKLLDFLSFIERFRESATQRRALAGWLEWLEPLVASVPRDEDQRDEGPEQILRDLQAATRWLHRDLDWPTVRDLVAWFVSGTSRRTLYDRGGIHVVDPYSLASAPYEVTVVIGVDDDLLPSREGSLVGLTPRLGDPEPRQELLNALAELWASTNTRLALVTSSRSVVDGSVQPWSSVIDDVRAEATLVTHPHSSYSSAERVPPREGFASYRSPLLFDPFATEVAQRVHQPRDTWWWSDLALPTSPRDDAEIDAEKLIYFLRHPHAVFARETFAGAHTRRSVEKARAVPPWRIEDSLDRYRVRQAYFESLWAGGSPVLETADSPLGSVAEPLRPLATHDLQLDSVRDLVLDIEGGLTRLGARPHSASQNGRSSFDHRDLVRGSLHLYTGSGGVFLLLPHLRKSLGVGALDVAVWCSLLTWELGEPVSVVSLSPLGVKAQDPKSRAAEGPSAWHHPGVVARLESVDDATDLVREWVALYDNRHHAVPSFFPRSALLSSSAITGRSTSPEEEWSAEHSFNDDSRGEDVVKLLVGESDYSELLDLGGGVVDRAQEHLKALVERVTWTPFKRVPWNTVLTT